MRPILVIGEVTAGSDGPSGAGAEMARRLADGSRPVILVSRIGHGEIGSTLVSALQANGVDCSAIQFDYDLPTLRSQAIVQDFSHPSAHDQLQWDSDLESLARRAGIVVCTSGIRRKGQARSTCDRALLAAQGVPRIFLAQQDTAVLGPVTRSLIGRAPELCEIMVVGPEAREPLRIRTVQDAQEFLQRENLLAALLSTGESLEVATIDQLGAIACPDGDACHVDKLLKSLANGIPINQAIEAMG